VIEQKLKGQRPLVESKMGLNDTAKEDVYESLGGKYNFKTLSLDILNRDSRIIDSETS